MAQRFVSFLLMHASGVLSTFPADFQVSLGARAAGFLKSTPSTHLPDDVVSGHHFSDGKMAFLARALPALVGSHAYNLKFSSRNVSRDT